MIGAISNALSGLQAAHRKAEAGASNIANISTNGALKSGDGPAPYTPLTTAQTADSGGVRSAIVPSSRPPVPIYDPDSPFADSSGLAGAPDVDLAAEAVTLKLAEHSYKANLKVMEAASDMQKEALSMFDRHT